MMYEGPPITADTVFECLAHSSLPVLPPVDGRKGLKRRT